MLLFVLLLLVLVSPAAGARLGLYGAESGDSQETYQPTGTWSIVTSPVVSGTYAWRTNPVTSATGWLSITLLNSVGVLTPTQTGVNDTWAVFRFRVATAPASGSEEILAQGGSGQWKFFVRLTSGRQLQAYDATETTQLGSTGSTVLALNTWYLIGIRVGTGASASYQVQINGVTELSGTGNLNTGGSSFISLGKTNNRNSQSVDYYYDDFAWDDTAYPPGNAILAFHPNANGSTMQWTAGTAPSNYTVVDEVVPSNTDYVQSASAGNVALFRFPAMSAMNLSSPAAVRLVVMVAEASNTTSNFSVRIRSGSTNSDSTGSDLGNTTFVVRQRLLSTDPATGSAWTESGIDAVEAGGVDGSGTQRNRMSYVALMVEGVGTAAPVPVPSTAQVY